MGVPYFAASFDSATAMVQALASALHDEPFEAVGQPWPVAAAARQVGRLPWPLRRQAYTWGGWTDAIPPFLLPTVSWERFGRWVTGRYPRRRYPAIAIGSSHGAVVHLCAALGIPWLPQTFLVPVRRRGDPDDPVAARAFGARHADRLLDTEPDLQLHHMHDANQDRLMVRRLTYFRVKGRRLSDAYRRFVDERLAAGGTLLVVDCQERWPVSRLGPRHVFQHGAVGGLSPDEYEHGSDRVAAFLAAEDAGRRSWPPTGPDDVAPEAEWGFEEALLADTVEYADRVGARVVRLSSDGVRALSPVVAGVYEQRWAELGVRDRCVLGESFMLLAPRWVLRRRAVPFWMAFPVEADADALARFLAARDVDELHLLLFSHGVESAGSVPAGRWRELLDLARSGGFVGVDPERFPRDFGVLGRYHRALPPVEDPPPPPLGLADALAALRAHGATVEEVAG